jgi:hypothetical protein
VRAALEPLIFNGIVRREDETDIARRIDEALATGCADAQTTNLRMRMLR